MRKEGKLSFIVWTKEDAIIFHNYYSVHSSLKIYFKKRKKRKKEKRYIIPILHKNLNKSFLKVHKLNTVIMRNHNQHIQKEQGLNWKKLKPNNVLFTETTNNNLSLRKFRTEYVKFLINKLNS